jgi:hypothetical protein
MIPILKGHPHEKCLSPSFGYLTARHYLSFTFQQHWSSHKKKTGIASA